jgi:outer membrane immunogenic protein
MRSKVILATVVLALSASPLWAGGTGPVVVLEVVPPEPVVPTQWAGAYAGLHLGYGQGSGTYTDGDLDVTEFDFPGRFLFGAQIGHNWQYGSFVWGVEGDYTRTNFEDGPVGGPRRTLAMSGVMTLRGRIGHAAGDWLFYGTAGLALGRLTESSAPGGNPANTFRTSTATATGWAAGLGIEHMMRADTSLRAEVMRVRVSHDFDTPRFDEGPTTVSATMFRLGVNYHF